jgi:hypothetical protein
MPIANAQRDIVRTVAAWPEVKTSPHRFGGTEFKVGRRELGHIHGDHQADIVLSMTVRNRVVSEGRAEPHHILPQSGWVTLRFRNSADVEEAVKLFRISYELAIERGRKTVAPLTNPE